jgi:hypothetical protein
MKKSFGATTSWLALGILLALAAAGCKKPNEEIGNALPRVTGVSFSPQRPGPGDMIRVVVSASDKEGDSTEVDYEWYVDGSKAGTGRDFDTADLGPGAKIELRFRLKEVSSGRYTDWDSQTITLGESIPARIKGVSISPWPIRPGTPAHAEVDYGDADPNQVTIYYRWKINGKDQEGDEFRGQDLDPQYYKRGDTLMVTVSTDEEFGADKHDSEVFTVANTYPIFTTEPYLELGDKAAYIRMTVEDADGDPIKYSVTGGPAGTSLNPDDGTVTIDLNQAQPGTYNLNIKAEDSAGASTSYNFTLTVPSKGAAIPQGGGGVQPGGEGGGAGGEGQ